MQIKKADYLFWSIMIIFALFYLLVGNDMHKEQYQMIEEKKKQLEQIKESNLDKQVK